MSYIQNKNETFYTIYWSGTRIVSKFFTEIGHILSREKLFSEIADIPEFSKNSEFFDLDKKKISDFLQSL